MIERHGRVTAGAIGDYDALHGIVDPDAATGSPSPISGPASNNSAAPRPSSPGPISTSLH